ncbi:Transcription elongation factor spt6 [Marasmius sp. AFHP31]|nr:Transcription elongation factor spt6 [Marasmius sp. AFHP31]
MSLAEEDQNMPAAEDRMDEDQPADEEGEGDEIMPRASDDSSEEEEDDEEEERRIRDGFIVDEDEDDEGEEDDDEDERRHRKRRKRRKKHHRRREEEDDGLEEDDLELLEENTGASFKKNRLKRLVRRGRSESPPTASSSRARRAVVESSDDDLEDEGAQPVHDIQRIWEERDDDDDDADGDIDDFIEYDDEDEGGMPMDERAREQLRKERRKQQQEARRKARGAFVDVAGIDANAWAEIHDVFGDGHEYDWALAGEDEHEELEDTTIKDLTISEVFEPSQIREHMLTEDDNLIRAQDTPERMQLATSSLSSSATLSLHKPLTNEELNSAAGWVSQRISPTKTRQYFDPAGADLKYSGSLVAAVIFVLRCLFVEEYEVPYIWAHKRDHLFHFDVNDVRHRKQLLDLPELWTIHILGQKYRSLLERKQTSAASYSRLGVDDSYYSEEIVPAIDSVEVVADVTEWLVMKYKDKRQDEATFRFHDDEENETIKKHKMPSRISAYEFAKKSIVSKLAEAFGIKSHDIVLNFLASHQIHFVEDNDLQPIICADQYVDPDPLKAQPAEELLRRARMIIATELGKDPLLRKEIRKVFEKHALVSVEPTERGVTKINDAHPYFSFKYLLHKPAKDMMQSSQFLHILRAEQELLVTVNAYLPADVKASFELRLNEAFASSSFSESAKAWNEERSRIVQEALEQHLLPAAVKWTREYIREAAEDHLASRANEELKRRIDSAPIATRHMAFGDTPSVLAVSWGKGDPQKDAITAVFMDDEGRMREHIKIDNLVDTETRDEFVDIIRRRKPDIIVVGGFSMATTKLSQRVKEIISGKSQGGEGESGPAFDIRVLYVPDELARIYHHSQRGKEEFGALSPIARYCIGLARYAQSPLIEYAALGSDITAISFVEDDQHLIPAEKLLSALERALVDITNKVGVDINRAVTDRYYRHLLQFVCGLGPRKARELITKIDSLGGSLANRNQFIRSGILTTKIFLNAAGFLRITQETEDLRTKHRPDDEQAPDPLDSTRIHPEDYELARKMATDALELDEEDIHDEHPSYVVTLIMQDDENDKKLSELNLDDFAVSLYEANQEQKRHTLDVIRAELLKPFAEQRRPFPPVTGWMVLTMLSGETPKTLRVGLITSVLVYRIRGGAASVRLDSGVEGFINPEYMSDDNDKSVAKGTSVQGVIIDMKLELETDSFTVELSTRRSDFADGDNQFRKVEHDQYWDLLRHQKDQEIHERKKRSEVDRKRRVIKHPNFHNFNTAQAEAHLDKQQRGDVVIRPSSKGFDHLAVTWKVDDGLFQHIDVTEINADPTGQMVGSQLYVDSSHTYADLDELIVNHVQAMARRVEDLMQHDRFKAGPEDELHLFLKNQLAANPAKSMYGFALNRKRPGHFNLCFLANKQSSVQTWPVRVAPEAYYLFEAAAVGVPELCDAFKVRHLHESQNLANNASGGKTPYGGRTPGRPSGHATPGRASVRPVGRTPNPYGGATPAPHYGATPSTYGQTPHGQTPHGQTPHGYATPAHRPQAYPPPPPSNLPPHGMNPARAAMIQQSTWGKPGSGWS